ncbi:MAG: MBOAT family protein [Ruminococcaceae bacterium]|nr:MBOAT family protein [Oscillospiraceae bacterium]
MIFSSLEFLFAYLPITLLLYFAVPFKFRNLVIFAVSMIFYGWGEPVYISLMVITILVNYICGYFIGIHRDNEKIARIFLILSVVVSLGILGFFKYFDFFMVNLSRIPFLDFLKPLGIELPIGISFYTFQIMSYTIDVYRGEGKMQKNIISFGAYVTLFPQLIAGPIVRYKDIDDQLNERDHNIELFSDGIRRTVAGLAKKVLLANTAGEILASFTSLPSDEMTVVGSWLGIILYTFQIYFDFSAYSDMAIGMGKMMGFTFLENFNYPYMAKSITDFWRRWHISLSVWFRDYVYIPLGGNRKGAFKTYRNLLIVWFLTGFWHGASWNYIIWGLYFFVILVCEKSFLLKALEKVPVVFQRLYSLFFIVIGWLIFYFEDSAAGFEYMLAMFGKNEFINAATAYDLVRLIPFVLISVVACTPYPRKLYCKLYDKFNTVRMLMPVPLFVFMLLAVAYLVDSSFNPFLYSQF